MNSLMFRFVSCNLESILTNITITYIIIMSRYSSNMNTIYHSISKNAINRWFMVYGYMHVFFKYVKGYHYV